MKDLNKKEIKIGDTVLHVDDDEGTIINKYKITGIQGKDLILGNYEWLTGPFKNNEGEELYSVRLV